MKHFNLFLCLIVSSLFANGQVKNQAKWQQNVDYRIEVTLNDTQHFLNGQIAMMYHNNSPDTLGEMYIHLWPNAYKNHTTAFAKQMLNKGDASFYKSTPEERGFIEGVAFSSEKCSVSLHATQHLDVVRLELHEALLPGDSMELVTPFSVKLPKVFSRLGHKDQDYFITQWYPKPAVYDVNGWNAMPYLNQGEFYSEFGSFDVSITLPENYTLVATGTSPSDADFKYKLGTGDSVPPSSNTLVTRRYIAHNVHDFAWFASKRFGVISEDVTIGDRTVTARIVGSKSGARFLAAVKSVLEYYSENVGLYPYPHATVVHGELKAGGGMEYPMITVCDNLDAEVIIHEVGHNWFYGILGTNEREYPWMDESINSFYTEQTLGHRKGLNTEMILGLLAHDQYLANEYQAIALKAEAYSWINYAVSVYGEGAKSFVTLKAYLGPEEFKKAMQFYYQQWKFKHPLPGDFQHAVETSSGKDLSWFFNDVLNASEPLDYGVKKKGSTVVLTNRGGVNAPIPVTYKRNGDSSIVWHHLAPGESRTIDSLGSEVVVDEQGVTTDWNVNNNQLKNPVKLKLFTGLDKSGQRELYALPVVGWNAYDKTMAGVYLSNQAATDKRFTYSLTPMYSFNKAHVVGMGSIRYVATGKGYGEWSETKLSLRSFSFDEVFGIQKAYRYTKLAPEFTYHFARPKATSKRSKQLTLRVNQVWLNPQFEIEKDTLSGPESNYSDQRSFVTATYRVENARTINPYSIQLRAEYGNITTAAVLGDRNNRQIRNVSFDTARQQYDTTYFFPFVGEDSRRDEFVRLSGILDYDFDIGLERPMHFRLFGSYLVKSYPNTVYKNSVGSLNRAGYYDYRFDDVLMHRNASYGLFRNQINPNRDYSKFVGPVAESDKWLMSANLTVPLPGKLPISPYIEILSFNGIKDGVNTPVTTSDASFFYTVGLELRLIPDRVHVFFNLAQSNAITSFQESEHIGIDKFSERITFSLNLNDLSIADMKKSIKLF